MKALLILFLLAPLISYAQTGNDYLDSLNHHYAITYGNNDFVYFTTQDSTAILTVKDKFFKFYSFPTNRSFKKKTTEGYLEQYTYPLHQEGYKIFIVKIEGIEPVERQLKLGRQE